MSDTEIIKTLNKDIKKKWEPHVKELVPLNLKKLSGNNIGYSEDPNGNVIGLSLNKSKISDISLLTGLGCLNYLYLRGNDLQDISMIKEMKRLTHLDLRDNSIEDISPLAELTNLTWLDLSENEISDISTIRKLVNLSKLLLGTNDISDISILGLENLTFLSLAFNPVNDFSILKSMAKLTVLDLSGTEIADYSFLKEIKNLTHLNLSSQKISDYSFCKALINLNHLELIGNRISDISFISKLKKLNHLYLRENEIVDISPLKALKNLTELDLSENSITDISFLSGLRRLVRVDLSSNKITQLPKTILGLNIEIKYIDINVEREEGEDFFDKGINFFGNPIENLPPAVIKKGRDAVERFFKPVEEDERKLIDKLFSELSKKYNSEENKQRLKRLIPELISVIKSLIDEYDVIRVKKDEKESNDNQGKQSDLRIVQASLGLLKTKKNRDFEILKDIIDKLPDEYLNKEERSYFNEAYRVIFEWKDFFLSYTTRGIPETNNAFRELISPVFKKSVLDDEIDSKNFAAKLIVRYLRKNRLKGFFDEDNIKCGDDLEEKIFEYCKSCFAFVQLIEDDVFGMSENKKNWCHLEFEKFNEWMIKSNIDSGKRYFFIFTFPDVLPIDEYEEPEFLDLYKNWVFKMRGLKGIVLKNIKDTEHFRTEMRKLANEIKKTKNEIIKEYLGDFSYKRSMINS